MARNTLKSVGIGLAGLAALFALVMAVFSGGAGAQMLDTNISVDQPDNQQLEVDVSFSGDTSVDVNLTSDGSVVESTTVSGTSGQTQTGTLDLTGVSAGDYSLVVTDDASASLSETRMITTQTNALNVSQNDTVAVDVEFDATETTTATVEWQQNTSSNTTTINFDPVEYEDGSGMKTVKWDAGEDGPVNVTVTTSPAAGYEAMWVSDDSGFLGGGGIIGGAGQTELVAFGVVILGLLYARGQELI
ncbi:hypothetical protein [Halovenus marina]|uniref:hypothetical protein n=1 Tax=Halovenus marina TaxID=3396621 RepID=UPI003F556887